MYHNILARLSLKPKALLNMLESVPETNQLSNNEYKVTCLKKQLRVEYGPDRARTAAYRLQVERSNHWTTPLCNLCFDAESTLHTNTA